MSGLVHRRPERAQVVRLVPRRHPDVRPRERGRERVHRRIEPVRALLEAEVAQDSAQELLLTGIGKSPSRNESSAGSPASRTIAVSSGRSTSKTAFTSAVVIPGSYSSRNASYGESPCSISSAHRSATSCTRRSAGRKIENRSCSRASSQATCALPPSRAHAAAISVGTRRAFSHSRRVTRTRLASSESWPSSVSSGATCRAVVRSRPR